MIHTSFSENESYILIEMYGSDGAGGYIVHWIIPIKGKPFRFNSDVD
jgi:hypothetical protein